MTSGKKINTSRVSAQMDEYSTAPSPEDSTEVSSERGFTNNKVQDIQSIKIWDIWIRLFHWLLALGVGFLLISGITGWQFFEWHRTVGEAVLVLLVFRLLWGIIGSSNARLWPLLANPLKAIKHLRELAATGKSTVERGHNAAGGLAVLVILAVIAFQATSGLFIADRDEMLEGRFYGVLSSDLSSLLMQWHYTFATVIQIVVGIHIVMIALYAIRASQNLVKPMITGRMSWPESLAVPQVSFRQWWVGLVLAVIIVAGFGRLLAWW